jgi:signal transduction histidine kinase
MGSLDLCRSPQSAPGGLKMGHDFQADIDDVQQIDAIPKILDVACRVTGTRFAAVARVTENRWIVCGVKDDIPFGLQPGSELPIETTFCDEIRQSRQPVIFENVAEDKSYNMHPKAVRYGIQSYISIPIIRPDGSFFGTLCALDIKPARLKKTEVIGMFRLFADLIGFHLEALDRLRSSRAALAQGREESELRERFIAVLGHELRNSISAIEANTFYLLQTVMDRRVTEVANEIKDSVRRLGNITNDLADFARGRLGGGLIANRDARAPLKPALEQVIAEFRSVSPDRKIEVELRWDEPVNCDRARVAQLLSNLISNALNYGAKGSPIQVRGFTAEGNLELSVSNFGDTIPAAEIAGLFQPFSRGSVGPEKEGLGLGLYIASEIARAHGGTLTASSSPEETRFTFRMPLS